MARPTKQTVDYFPHAVNHGKTLYILESRWGNDGYAFWFKLLEMLGSKNGMFIDCDNESDWEFLLAKTHTDEETANEILNVLSKLGAIDPVLWGARVIFCQNFVDGVADAFSRRREQLPTQEGVIAYINSVKPELLQTLTGKGKERERKGKKENNNPPKTSPIDDEISHRKEVAHLYLETFNRVQVPSSMWQKFDALLSRHPIEEIRDAFDKLACSQGKTWGYLLGILNGNGKDKHHESGIGGSYRKSQAEGKRQVSDGTGGGWPVDI